MRQQTVFDRIGYLEAKMERLERIVREQTEILRASGLTVEAAAYKAVETPRLKKMRKICNDVCVANELSLSELRGANRRRHVAWPRQDAMRFLAEAGYSTNEIGRYLGNRDHTTILHGIAASRARAAE